jgi:hypothetical protein
MIDVMRVQQQETVTTTEKAMKENNTTHDNDNTAIAWKYINELDINKCRLLINKL